ncbi:MAG: DUF748 domain-containing protein [Steroidobacteraceae bacterium]
MNRMHARGVRWPEMRAHDKWLWAVLVVAVFLVAAHAALPHVVEDQVNRRLMALESYDGHVEDVDLALWRGAYRLDGVRIVKTGSRQPVPFFSAERIDFSVEWRSLLRGRLVAECVLSAPKVNLVRAESEARSQLGQGVDWAGQLDDSFPFRFNTIEVHDGAATFRAPGIESDDALTATNIDGEITNMTNVVDSGKETFAGFAATAEVLESGSAKIAGSANPLAKTPTFDVNLTVKGVQLPQVNPWLREYIKADAESGSFELYTELAAAGGRFEGYAKPIMREVNIYSSAEPESNPLKRLWEGLVDFAAEVFEDEDTGQVAARIPFSGTIKNPEAGLFETIMSVVHNAFVSAFARSLEGSVSIRDVRKNLGKIGDKPKDEQKD